MSRYGDTTGGNYQVLGRKLRLILENCGVTYYFQELFSPKRAFLPYRKVVITETWKCESKFILKTLNINDVRF